VSRAGGRELECGDGRGHRRVLPVDGILSCPSSGVLKVTMT
jgi:hypothetical protein